MSIDRTVIETEEPMCLEEKKLREELALCYRVGQNEDLHEGTSN